MTQYPYRIPLGIVLFFSLFALVVEAILIYLAQTNDHPWNIEFSPANARIFFWIAGAVGFVFFGYMVVIAIGSYLTGKITLGPSSITAPKSAFRISPVTIPYAAIKFIRIDTVVAKGRPANVERIGRTLNIFHEKGQTYITEGLLAHPAVLDDIFTRLFDSLSPLAQQFTERANREVVKGDVQ